MRDDWWAVLKFDTRGAAEAVAAVLEADAVPTAVDARQLVAGVDSGFVLSVPRSLVHRAKWVLAQSELNDSELNYFATGELPEQKE